MSDPCLSYRLQSSRQDQELTLKNSLSFEAPDFCIPSLKTLYFAFPYFLAVFSKDFSNIKIKIAR